MGITNEKPCDHVAPYDIADSVSDRAEKAGKVRQGVGLDTTRIGLTDNFCRELSEYTSATTRTAESVV